MTHEVLRAPVDVIRAAARDVLGGRWPASYAFTFVAEMGVLLGGVVTLKISGDLLGAAGFGEYAVGRRAISILTFPLLVGLGISVARYVARSVASDASGPRGAGYFLAAVLIAVPIGGAFAIVSGVERARFAQAFYGDVRFAPLTLPIVVAVIGLYAHTLVYAHFRGRLWMWRANLLQLVNLGLTPPLAVLASHRSAAAALEITGRVWLATSVAAGSWGMLQVDVRGLSAAFMRRAVGELLRFGVPRVGGEFALFGLFALPTFYVAHTAGVESAGFLSFSLSLVQMVSSLFAAVGVLLLPYVSRQVVEGGWDSIARVVARGLGASLSITLILVVLLHATLNWLIPAVMGPAFVPAIHPARWLITGAVPFVVYTLLREPMDAIAVWPYNTVNLLIALGVVAALLWVGGGVVSPGAAVALGLALLGGLSFLAWSRALRAARARGSQSVTVLPGDPDLGV